MGFLSSISAGLGRLWHIPGRAWAGMMAAGSLSLWLTAGAAMAWTVMSAAYVRFFGERLTPDQAERIIQSAHLLVGLSILAITGREISLSITRRGLQANVGKDDVPEVKPDPDRDPEPEADTGVDKHGHRTRFVPPPPGPNAGELPPDQRLEPGR